MRMRVQGMMTTRVVVAMVKVMDGDQTEIMAMDVDLTEARVMAADHHAAVARRQEVAIDLDSIIQQHIGTETVCKYV